METPQPLKYCLYARKSSESDERQAMSIDSQLAEMRALADNEGLHIVAEKQESHSAKDSGKRPVYNELLQGIRNDEYDAVLCWDPSRLSRNAGDLGSLVDLMDSGKLLHIRTYSQTFTNNPNEKFLLMILCSQAKLENDNKSVNVKRGIKAKCEMGWRPGAAPLGYMNRHFNGVKDIIPDPERAHVITEMYQKAGYHGWSGRRLKEWCDETGFTNRSGKPIALSQVFLILTNPFYYGEFEYPEGKWFKGSHEPLISKELFELVQQFRGVYKGKWGSKQFAYRGLLRCGHCGGEVSSEEKFKKLKNGEFNRHVYYRCTKKVDLHCPERYINEKDLEDLLQEFIANNVDRIKITDKLRANIERHYVIAESLADYYKVTMRLDKPLIEYARYVVTKGSFEEKRTLTQGIASKLIIKNGTVSL
jgi:DNA invertase Pin-like site-specific DNA recombinase